MATRALRWLLLALAALVISAAPLAVSEDDSKMGFALFDGNSTDATCKDGGQPCKEDSECCSNECWAPFCYGG
jgi:hypothetical protein